MKACLGKIDTGEEGPGAATEMTSPEVGDDRYGVLTTVQEAGGGGEWLLHNTLVRQGGVLMMVDVVDIHLGVDPLFTTDDVGAIVTTAAAGLPGALAVHICRYARTFAMIRPSPMRRMVTRPFETRRRALVWASSRIGLPRPSRTRRFHSRIVAVWAS